MNNFRTLDGKDYTVENLNVSAPMSWELVSSSYGMQITAPDDLEGAITVQRASNDESDYYYNETPKINNDSGIYEYIMYRSVKNYFYDNCLFISGSKYVTKSIAGIPNESYVISIGENFYGDRIKPGTFELATELTNKTVYDDGYGNLFVSQSGTGSYVGNIFYNRGVAVIKQDTGSAVTALSKSGLKLVSSSLMYLDYSSDVNLYRHEANIKIDPHDFNGSLNVSLMQGYKPSTQLLNEYIDENILPTSGSDGYYLYTLMGAGKITPYITSIGLYNDQYELLAVAKLSEPIQRTFDMSQIFIVRFDT